MRYLIIGLGIYGSNLAVDLTAMGHEVIGADKDPVLVDSIKDFISTAYIIDSTEEVSLSVLPLKNVDLVIVAIGENFGASIRTVAILKKLRVEHIYARAIDKLHESILQGFNIDRIITPEQRAATDLVNEMSFGNNTESLKIDATHIVVRFPAPEFLLGLKYSELDLENDYSLKIITATRNKRTRNLLGVEQDLPTVIDNLDDPDTLVEPGDRITCFGTQDSFRQLFRRYS